MKILKTKVLSLIVLSTTLALCGNLCFAKNTDPTADKKANSAESKKVNSQTESKPSPGAPSTGVKVSFVLDKLEVSSTSEKSGDELYLSIAQYSTTQKPQIINVPQPPMHWLSQSLSKINKVNVWEKSIVDNETVKLVMSLVEMDNPPWNPDDFIGALTLEIKNEKGKISVKSLDDNAKAMSIGKSNTIVVNGNESEYKLTYRVVK